MPSSRNVASASARGMFSSRWITCIVFLLATVSVHATRYVYDDAGRVIGVVDQAGQAARYQYDAVGNLLAVAAPTTDALVFALQPDHGPPGTQVRVIGNALPTSPGQQVLFSGSTSAPLLAATAQEIQFTVPAVTIGMHALTLEDSGNTLPLGDFEVTTGLGPPTIASVSHSCAKFDSVVSLTGSNFDVRPDATRVEVGGRLARVTAITETALSFRAPLHTPGGPVRVTTEAGSAQSSSVLYLVTTTGDPCLDMTPGIELQIDGGAVSTSLIATNKVVQYAFYAQRGQWLSFQFANPSLSNYTVQATVLAPEGRALALLDVMGNQYESLNLTPTNMSLHPLPIERTGFHVLQLKLKSTVALTLDTGVNSAATLTKDSITAHQAAPGQSIRMIYSAEVGDQLGLGLLAQNSTPESVFSSLYLNGIDHRAMTPEPASSAGCNEGSNCSLNIKTFAIAGDYPVFWVPQSSVSLAQATLWVNDDQRPQLMPNIPQQVAITRTGQNARFPVYAEAGSGFSINVRNVSLTPSNGSVNFWLYAPDGTRITTKLVFNGNVGYFGAPGAMISAFQVPMTGMYTAMLDPASGGLASGEIELDPGLRLVVDDPMMTVNTTGGGRAGRFVIDGVAGEKIGVGIRNIQLTPSVSQWLGVRLYLPSGDLVADTTFALCYQQSASYPGCEFDLGPLPFSGSYVITLESSTGLNAATYEILATHDVEGALTDTAQSVEILRHGGNARLYFQGAPGSAKTIHIDSQVANPSGTQVIYGVLRPDGFPLVAPLYAAGAITGSAPATLRIGDFPLAGTYTVFVDPQYAGMATFNASISDGVLDNSQIPVLQTVVPGPWFWSTLEAVPGMHPSIGVQIQSLTNPSGTLKIEVVDPLNRRLIDYDAAINPPYTSCSTSQNYCDFDFMDVWTPGTHQIVVWPGTPRREDAQLTVTPVTDLEVTGRDVTFSTFMAGQNVRVNFDAQSGEALKLVLTRQSTTNPTTDVWVYAFDPSGNRIGNTTLWNGSNTLTWNLPGPIVTGTYSIVTDTRYGTPFSLRAQLLPQ